MEFAGGDWEGKWRGPGVEVAGSEDPGGQEGGDHGEAGVGVGGEE